MDANILFFTLLAEVGLALIHRWWDGVVAGRDLFLQSLEGAGFGTEL